MSDTSISFEENGVYILLTDVGEPIQFHWGLYLALSEEHGRVFHFVNNINTNHEWKFDSHLTTGIPNLKFLLVALKIAVMDRDLHEPLLTRLEAVSATPPISCRIWLMRSLEGLDNEGYIKLSATSKDVVGEGEMFAIENKLSKNQTTKQSSLSSA
ncbi:hypothetical protein BJY01DRAFT_247333 [Aspergillus pseudoustus]|uniref:Uncharacterized protein n=1 Tax=Aspergillus pseudoustus TaxID=1810923 RepID=A0ABR4K1F6_9EURO